MLLQILLFLPFCHASEHSSTLGFNCICNISFYGLNRIIVVKSIHILKREWDQGHSAYKSEIAKKIETIPWAAVFLFVRFFKHEDQGFYLTFSIVQFYKICCLLFTTGFETLNVSSFFLLHDLKPFLFLKPSKDIKSKTMASARSVIEKEQKRLSLFFHAYDVANLGCVEKEEFATVCQDRHIPSQKADGISNRAHNDKSSRVTLEEFVSGSKERHRDKKDDTETGDNKSSTVRELSKNKGQLQSRWEMKSYSRGYLQRITLNLFLWYKFRNMWKKQCIILFHITEALK